MEDDEADTRAFWDLMQRTTGARSASWDNFSATFEVCYAHKVDKKFVVVCKTSWISRVTLAAMKPISCPVSAPTMVHIPLLSVVSALLFRKCSSPRAGCCVCLHSWIARRTARGSESASMISYDQLATATRKHVVVVPHSRRYRAKRTRQAITDLRSLSPKKSRERGGVLLLQPRRPRRRASQYISASTERGI